MDQNNGTDRKDIINAHLMCDAISKSMDMVGDYDCPHCDTHVNHSCEEIFEHLWNYHQYKYIEMQYDDIKEDDERKELCTLDLFACDTCEFFTYDRYDLAHHMTTEHPIYNFGERDIDVEDDDESGDGNDDNDDNDDSDDSDDGMAYVECPECGEFFRDQYSLGEHYINLHNDYENQLNLDGDMNYGHPGIDILREIGMINKRYVMCNSPPEYCIICTEKYTPTKSKTDDDMHKHERYLAHTIFRCDMNTIFMNGSVREKIILVPLRLECCGTHICKSCIEKHISYKGLPECPFCKKNHERYDLKYIVVKDKLS